MDTGPGLRRDDRADPPRRHGRHAAGPPRPRGRRAARRDDGRHRRRQPRPGAPGHEDVSYAPKLDTEDARVRLAALRPSPSTGRSAAAPPRPGAWTTFRGERLKLGPVRMPQGPVAALAPGELRAGKRTVLRRHGHPARRARRGPPRREAADARRGLGPRGADRGRGAGSTHERHRGSGRPAAIRTRGRPTERTRRAAAPPGRASAAGAPSRPGSRHTRCSARLPTAPTRTSRCPRSSDGAASTGRDAAFATELAFGTLRLQGRYDAVIAVAAGRADRRHRPAGPRRPPARGAPAPRDAGPRPCRRRPDGRPRPGRRGRGGRRASSTPSCGG